MAGASRIATARAECFGYKPPLKWGKGEGFSPALWLVARLFWLHRLVTPFQWIKFVLRGFVLDDPKANIPPIWAELLAFVPPLLLIANLALLAQDVVLISLPFAVIAALIVWRMLDVLLVNAYYLMMRPMVETMAPHNRYRSFILGCTGFFELVLWVATLWFYAARDRGIGDQPFTAILARVLKGDPGVMALADSHSALDVFCKITFGIMLTVVVSRAIALVPDLPDEDGK